jgi:HTH-type transcriptional regulator/antitoxin HigA
MKTNEYFPNEVSPPGETLQELLGSRGITQSQLAERTGKHVKNINAIIQGKEAISPTTALSLERALGVPAAFWNEREKNYRAYLARIESVERLETHVSLLKDYPIKEMAKHGWLRLSRHPVQQLEILLKFFGIASPDQLESCWTGSNVAYRHSPAFKSNPKAVAAWLRCGEIEAEKIRCKPFNRIRFERFLSEIRKLTETKPDEFAPALREGCARCGVAVVFVPEIAGTHLSGARVWMLPSKARIQLSLRHKSNDHLWFTFLHEAAHVLKHPKRMVYIDSKDCPTNRIEEEANAFARDWLIPPDRYDAFIAAKNFSAHAVVRFAESLGIAAGIVVGRLQHDGHIGHYLLNNLKQRFRWSNE